jgi:hypothetical protein
MPQKLLLNIFKPSLYLQIFASIRDPCYTSGLSFNAHTWDRRTSLDLNSQFLIIVTLRIIIKSDAVFLQFVLRERLVASSALYADELRPQSGLVVVVEGHIQHLGPGRIRAVHRPTWAPS